MNITRIPTPLIVLALSFALVGARPASAEGYSIRPHFNYLVGRGVSDITGPVTGLQLWGFGRPDQVGEGLHIRLGSRAFIVADRARPDDRRCGD